MEKHGKSFVKGITWRIIGTLDTIFLSWLFTGQIGNALKIGGTEVFTKIILFYLHERIWLNLNFGRTKVYLNKNETPPIDDETEEQEVVYKDKGRSFYYVDKHWRSVIKGISWRIVGTIDTIIIATLWTGDYSKALKIGFTEVFTKVLLFYLHERIWQKIQWNSKEVK